MKLRTLVLGSAASLSLALAFAAPGFAQSDMNPPQVSTPAEKQQTQQLNGQATSGTTAPSAQLNGDAAGGAAQQARTDAQQQQYEQQQQQYQAQQAQYRDEHARYERDIHRYDTAQYYFTDYPHRSFAYRYDNDPQLLRLSMIAEPSQQLARAPVEGPDGQWIGKVRNVETGPDGLPSRVEVALNRRVSVWVRPGNLRFDATDHIVFTDLTRADLWQLPGATYESDTAYRP